MHRALILCLVLGLVLGLSACKKVKMETLTLPEFNEFCLSDASLDCEEACGAVSSALRPDFSSAAQCRAACDKAGQDFQMNNIESGDKDCAGSIGTAVDLCSEYCDGHFPK